MNTLPPLSEAVKTLRDYGKTVILTGIKDTDLLILQKLDDEDLLQACLVNKAINRACKDESFWRNRSLEKYPLPSNYKLEKETWRYFYLKIVHYRSKYNLWAHLLRQACFIGDLSLVALALDKKKEIVNAYDNLPLILANQGSYYEIMKYLILHGADPNVNNGDILHWNCAHGNLDIVQFLLEHGLMPQLNLRNGLALRLAATKNKTDIVKYLIAKGANINIYNDETLKRYVERGDLEMVKFLLERGANVTEESEIFRAAIEKGHLNIVEYLDKRGLNADKNRDTLVLTAVKTGKLDMVKYLVEHGYPITPDTMNEAKTKGYIDIVDFFRNKV